MKYDLSKPASLPLTLGAHVIVDTRDGTTYTSAAHLAYQAMGHQLRAMTRVEKGHDNEALVATFGKEAAAQIGRFAVASLYSTMFHDDTKMAEFIDQPNELIQVGPFVTWDQCLHNKHSELMTQRMERFANSPLSEFVVKPEEIDIAIAAQMRSDIVEQRAKIAEAKAADKESPKEELDEILKAIFGGTGFSPFGGRR